MAFEDHFNPNFDYQVIPKYPKKRLVYTAANINISEKCPLTRQFAHSPHVCQTIILLIFLLFLMLVLVAVNLPQNSSRSIVSFQFSQL